MSRRSDAKLQVVAYKQLLVPFIGKIVIIKFDSHSFNTVINDLVLARLSDLDIKPDPREGEENNYRPPVMTLDTQDGKLHFIIEDTSIASIFNGLLFTVGNVKLEMRIADASTTNR